jgi:hypothetical protein
MASQIRLAVRVLGAIVLVAVALFCSYGFLASFEAGFPQFPNAFHLLYGAVDLTAVIGVVWLADLPAIQGDRHGQSRSELEDLLAMVPVNGVV